MAKLHVANRYDCLTHDFEAILGRQVAAPCALRSDTPKSIDPSLLRSM
jgi:hypothetical protein